MINNLNFENPNKKQKRDITSLLLCCEYENHEKKMTKKMAKIMQKLEEIDLSGMQKLTSGCFNGIIESCKYLRKLNLNGCSLIDDNMIEKLCCRNLVELFLNSTKISSNSISKIKDILSSLKLIDISSCIYVDDEFLEILSSSSKISLINISNCQNCTESVFKIIENGKSFHFINFILLIFFFFLNLKKRISWFEKN